MNLTDPKYIKSIIKDIISDVNINNYYKKCNGDYKDERGYSVIFYEPNHDISGSICSIEHKGIIKFNLEFKGHTVISGFQVSYNEIRQYHYDYYIDIVNNHLQSRKKESNMLGNFLRNKIPTNYVRNNKIDNILEIE